MARTCLHLKETNISKTHQIKLVNVKKRQADTLKETTGLQNDTEAHLDLLTPAVGYETEITLEPYQPMVLRMITNAR